MRIACMILALSLLLATRVAAVAVAQPQPFPAEIRRALEAHARAIDAFSLTLNIGIESTRPRREVAALLNLDHPDSFFASVQWRLAWQDGLHYSRHTVPRIDGRTQLVETSFNGFAYYAAVEHESISRLRSYRTAGALEVYLAAVGLEITPDFYTPRLRSRILALLDEGAQLSGIRRAAFAGRQLTVITILDPGSSRPLAYQDPPPPLPGAASSRQAPSGSIETSYWLDPGLNYAVRRIDERLHNGPLLARTYNADFERFGSGDVWLPRSVAIEFYTAESAGGPVQEQPIATRTLDIQGPISRTRLPVETFTIATTEVGMVVTDDLVSPVEIQFTIESGMEDLVRAFLTLDPRDMPPHMRVIPAPPVSTPSAAPAPGVPASAGLESDASPITVPAGRPLGVILLVVIVLAAGVAAAILIMRR